MIKQKTREQLMKQFGKNVLKCMKQKNITQVTLAKKTGLDKSTLNNIIHGRKFPSNNTTISLARALGVSISSLWEGVEK